MADQKTSNNLLGRQNIEISPQVQETLNKPLDLPEGLEQKDREFLNTLMEKIQKGEIKLYQPSSLVNHAVYDKLPELSQAKAEVDSFNLLSTIRDINRLWQSGERETYQISNLVHKIRTTKERLEEEGGDIFII